MKVTLAISVMIIFVGSVASAPVTSREEPAQLVVLTTKALKALGVKISGNALHTTTFDGFVGEDLQMYGGHLSNGSQGQHLMHKVRHSRHRFSGKGCPRGWKKDASGKCRRIW